MAIFSFEFLCLIVLAIFILLVLVCVPVLIIVLTKKKTVSQPTINVAPVNDVFANAAKNPSDFSVDSMIAFIEKNGCPNSPQYRNRLKGVWCAVNQSSEVSTEKKKQLKQFLMLKGIDLTGNERIIDNHRLY